MKTTAWVRSHARKTSVEAANILLNRDIVFLAIGALNRRWGIIESVFCFYGATPEMTRIYVYERRMRENRWKPGPVGLIVQNRKLTLMFGVTSTEVDFWDEENRIGLSAIHARMERIRTLVGARQKTFAGVLPGLLVKHDIDSDPPEGDITASVVAQAVQDLSSSSQERPEVIVLGGRGYIGRRLVSILTENMEVHPVDALDDTDRWPHHLAGRPALLVTVANRTALPRRLEALWPGVTVLNEVFPEPDPETLEVLAASGIPVHHVVGVKGRAYPPFPGAYRGAIPCCAAWPSDEVQVVTRALN